jgi:hypothetical protein
VLVGILVPLVDTQGSSGILLPPDLQDENHYRNVITLVRHVPDVKIWMPTREINTIQNVHREMIRHRVEFPKYLIPRVSANKIDGKPPRGFPFTSAVVTGQDDASCVAQLQKNHCDGEIANCRACWTDQHVTYPLQLLAQEISRLFILLSGPSLPRRRPDPLRCCSAKWVGRMRLAENAPAYRHERIRCARRSAPLPR